MSSSTTLTVDGQPQSKHRIRDFLLSSIGAKTLMALSGAGLWAYLFLHFVGNLPVLVDRTSYNGYAEMLQGNPPLLWTERVLVFGGMFVHAAAGLRLARLNRVARGHAYARRDREKGSLASATMIVTGLLILAFFVFHILHFTTHSIGAATFEREVLADGTSRPDAYLMVHTAFSRGWVVAVYVIGQALLFSHLYHGSLSLFQSLGIHPVFASRGVGRAAKLIVALLIAAAMAIPLSIFFLGR